MVRCCCGTWISRSHFLGGRREQPQHCRPQSDVAPVMALEHQKKRAATSFRAAPSRGGRSHCPGQVVKLEATCAFWAWTSLPRKRCKKFFGEFENSNLEQNVKRIPVPKRPCSGCLWPTFPLSLRSWSLGSLTHIQGFTSTTQDLSAPNVQERHIQWWWWYMHVHVGSSLSPLRRARWGLRGVRFRPRSNSCSPPQQITRRSHFGSSLSHSKCREHSLLQSFVDPMGKGRLHEQGKKTHGVCHVVAVPSWA